jgi:hypothetical protein
MRTKSLSAVFSYFRPATQLPNRRRVPAAQRVQTRRAPVVTLYIHERAELNRAAHFLAGVLSTGQLGEIEPEGILQKTGINILLEAYRALELNPEPSARDVRKIERIRVAIDRFLIQIEKRLDRIRIRRRTRLRHS